MCIYDGKRAFFILTRELDERENKFFKQGNIVLKPDFKVLKLYNENDVESRLSTLESKIDEILEFLFKNRYLSIAKSPKNNGLGAIRTPDLRRVKIYQSSFR